MTLRLVILDDEALIAHGLAWHVPWSDIGAEVVAVATNGESGWQAIVTHRPDIVISDIVMPELDGLELAERLNRELPETRLILISAHRQFEYAQRAIQQGVDAYILKPIEPDKLLRAVSRVGEALQRERARSEHLTHLERVVKHTEPIASASLLFQIARFGGARLSGLAPEVTDQLPPPYGVLIWLRLDPEPRREEAELFLRAGRMARERLERVGYTVIEGEADGKLPLLLLRSPDADVSGSATLREAADEVTPHGTADGATPHEMTDGGATPHDGADGGADGLQGRDASDPRVRAFRALAALLDDICASIRASLHRVCSAVISRSFTSYSELHRIYRETEPLTEPSRLTEEGGAIAAEDQALYLGQGLEARMLMVIDQHYREAHFGLDACGEILHMSPHHVSRLYKQRTGRSFLEHLTDRRIREATRLLTDTALNIAEVARQSGFSDPRYFSQVFRRHCGMTPTEYRQRHT